MERSSARKKVYDKTAARCPAPCCDRAAFCKHLLRLWAPLRTHRHHFASSSRGPPCLQQHACSQSHATPWLRLRRSPRTGSFRSGRRIAAPSDPEKSAGGMNSSDSCRSRVADECWARGRTALHAQSSRHPVNTAFYLFFQTQETPAQLNKYSTQ
jgi:hypothetical protein